MHSVLLVATVFLKMFVKTITESLSNFNLAQLLMLKNHKYDQKISQNFKKSVLVISIHEMPSRSVKCQIPVSFTDIIALFLSLKI